MASTPKPVRRAIKKKVAESRKEIKEASAKRYPTKADKKRAMKFYKKAAEEGIKHNAKQGYVSRKGKILLGSGISGKINATMKGGYNRNRGTDQTKNKLKNR